MNPPRDPVADLLAQGIGYPVTQFAGASGSDDALVQLALVDPDQVHTEASSTGDDLVRQATRLPSGMVAVWCAPLEQANRVARHAQSILDLEASRQEGRGLLREVESLTVQVMQDFEELALIRALSSNLELPQNAEDTQDFVLESLLPLAAGVGAVSIAILLRDERSGNLMQPLWTGPAVISDTSVRQLVDRYTHEAQSVPVVRNDCFGDQPCGREGLNELVLVPCSSEGRVHGYILACNRIKEDLGDDPWGQPGFTTMHASLMETAANQLASHLQTSRLLRQKEELFTDVIRALVNAIEARDPYTCGHSERVACFARLLASHLGFTSSECERLYLTGLLHDVGKIAIPDVVLRKPTKLNDQERAIIETHTDYGWRILHELDALQHVLPGVLYHHEHWDGRGYPDKLAGENIPIDGRILAVCDAFDAMTSDRPYRSGMSVTRCLQIMQEGAGTIWDPALIDLFLEHLEEILEIRSSHRPRRHPDRPAPVNGQPTVPLAPVAMPSISTSDVPTLPGSGMVI
ncbi:HD-GYP domain-containing protein [Roseiconus nitratireducens]|uniref:HD-GYP domain-containing protein n=1 Tax=Roseiconus nitratireducens TaxID=2605748 RepID=A0A5M6DDC6_9BACT|nr:HD-GYP domain-containing protein [Roseiconus nitratireducens]KAA5545518.1 HD-GYP domain-containing protein [Roseiconus nitratireducens]